jgi:superoxide dismutase, Cu-Zn family
MSIRRILATGSAAVTLAALASTPASAAAGLTDTGRQPLISYNATYVPAGATARVRTIANAAGDMVVTLQVRGLSPNREYGAHAHKLACSTTDPLAAGGHFQYVEGGATDPAFANAENEVWLDFTTDSEGNASAQTLVRWQFPADRRAHSVIIHDHHTDPGGIAGSRYGCLTVDF